VGPSWCNGVSFMNYLPIFLDLRGKPVLVAGGDAAALRKVRLLRAAGANVAVVAPRLCRGLAELAGRGEIAHRARGFVAGDLAGCAAAIAASGRADVDARVAEAAQARNLPVNVVDRPELCSFIVPAIVDRDPLIVAVSSGGAAPVLARRVRARIEALLPARLGCLVRFAESFRTSLRASMPEAAARLRFWECFFDGPVAAALLAGRESEARERMLALVNRPETVRDGAGRVAIVGAGPGDPDLLTLRALRLLQEADVLVYDRLVAPEILDYARRDAERIYVGKAKGSHARSQVEINALLVKAARDGRCVVRLKGGDPFVFGRGGEELEHLARHAIPVEVVPGITAATGCAAASGIPLTHRAHAAAVTFVTGHGRNGEPEIDWAALAQSRQTLVVYMGVSVAGLIAARLIDNGLPAGTPVAVVENGTRADQKTVAGTLRELEELIAEHGIVGPAVIIIGEVVRASAALENPARQSALAG